ncbi:MAG: GTPase Era, partial [Chitinophagaceae bacterium]|nr:GTPase Era [Chitinophagaceae bacterium]
MTNFKSGFVGIFGRPNAGKSTLLNALLHEKLAIVSPKAQTTRNQILGILTEKDYQIIFSDTPGLLQSKYKLHERMMREVDSVRQGTDVLLYLIDANDNAEENKALLEGLKFKGATLLIINKIDKAKPEKISHIKEVFASIKPEIACIEISALQNTHLDQLLALIVEKLPSMPAYYDDDTLTDRPMR